MLMMKTKLIQDKLLDNSWRKRHLKIKNLRVTEAGCTFFLYFHILSWLFKVFRKRAEMQELLTKLIMLKCQVSMIMNGLRLAQFTSREFP
jgi:hypothetical protein